MKQKLLSAAGALRRSPWQVKLSMVVMGLGQLCYGQIVKGLFYLLCRWDMLFVPAPQG